MTKKIRNFNRTPADIRLEHRLQRILADDHMQLSDEDREIAWVALEGAAIFIVQCEMEVGQIVSRLRRDDESKTRMELPRKLAALPFVDFEYLEAMQQVFERWRKGGVGRSQ